MKTQTAPVTHKQIADSLGVSHQLVGFALRGVGSMSDHKRQAILDEAQRLGYDQYANREARSMVSRRHGKRAKSGIVALTFDAIFEGRPLPLLPYFAPIFGGIEGEAARRGLDLVLCPLRPERPSRLIMDGQVDGFISLMHSYRVEQIFQGRCPADMPVVYIGDKTNPTASLCSDARDGTFQATTHLIELGHRDIAYIGVSDERATTSPHFDGYKEALRAASIEPDTDLTDCQSRLPSLAGGREAVARLLERGNGKPRFTALVAYNDLLAMGGIQILQEGGYNVPGDISVTGFDDVSHEYGFTPALTSVTFEREALGVRAVEMLCRQIDETREHDQAALHQKFPVKLVVRNSTRPV